MNKQENTKLLIECVKDAKKMREIMEFVINQIDLKNKKAA